MSGLDAQIGWKSESTFGTAVTPDQFHAGYLGGGPKQEIARLESQGLRAGRRVTSKWKSGGKTITGTVNLELWDEPLATLLTHMFGSVATSGTGPWTHTATPGSLNDNSFTLQVGRPDSGDTVRAFTYAGCKIASWTINCAVGEIPTLELEVSAQTETTATALASASYPTAAPFTFVEASLTIAGSAVNTVTDVSLSAANALRTDGHRLGSADIREQLENGMREFTGTLTSEFEDLTAYNRFVNGTEAALVVLFDNGTDTLTITTNVRFDGETPEVSGPELLEQPLPFKCLSTTSDAAAITAELVNQESAAT